MQEDSLKKKNQSKQKLPSDKLTCLPSALSFLKLLQASKQL
jgi:hypothetical protein